MQIPRRNIMILCIGLIVAGMVTLAALGSRGQNNLSAAKQENPTPVQEGVKTEKQREHGKLFSQRYEYRKNQKLRDLKGHGDIQVTIGVGDKPRSSSAPSFNLNEFLRNMTFDSDAILVGQVQDKVSQLTENGEFTFTDYEVTVEEVLKNNATSPINPQSNITVTRPGGAILLNSQVIRGVDLSYKPFELGSRVLLFLKFIPMTGAYKAFRSEGSFVLVGNGLLKLTKESLPAELESEKDAQSFISKIRSQALISCDK
ncbi:MAG: hypothetical protein DMF68_14240 [Acidobacteria bacterium]|nr:MAG: hypothetical protein DMF68_14240 [Acidobacteriota bacterium]